MGTSAGALSGSLFSAGYSPKQVKHSACGHPFKLALRLRRSLAEAVLPSAKRRLRMLHVMCIAMLQDPPRQPLMERGCQQPLSCIQASAAGSRGAVQGGTHLPAAT